MKTHDLHIVFSGGGTAGHLFPGLAVAAEMHAISNDTRITFAGSGKAFEERSVTQAGFNYIDLPCAPAPQRATDFLRFVAQNWTGYRQAQRFLFRERVNAVVGLGGYASVPLARAAIAAGIPLILLEQNAFPGRATRWLAPKADLICAAFAESCEHVRPYLPNPGHW